jgi:hypothetical protein
MLRMAEGKYSALLRDDYLPHINRLREGRGRDSCIEEAILEYVALSEEIRDRETERQEVSITVSAGAEREYHMLADQILIPDNVVGRLEPFDIYGDLDVNLNAAIRLWLETRGVEGLRP